MYCVKCGVKLQDGVKACPLCQTPVWNPDGLLPEGKYPETMPKNPADTNLPSAIFFTIICAVSIIVILVVCFNIHGNLAWGGYPILAILLFYIIFILPNWFKKPNPVIFTPIDFFAIAVFLAYVNYKANGDWFLTFALPIVVLTAIDLVTVITLAKYVKRGGLFIAGGAVIFLGIASVIVEFFASITFNTRMFTWSLYSLSVFVGFGIFLIIAGIYKPLKQYLKRHFFFQEVYL